MAADTMTMHPSGSPVHTGFDGGGVAEPGLKAPLLWSVILHSLLFGSMAVSTNPITGCMKVRGESGL